MRFFLADLIVLQVFCTLFGRHVCSLLQKLLQHRTTSWKIFKNVCIKNPPMIMWPPLVQPFPLIFLLFSTSLLYVAHTLTKSQFALVVGDGVQKSDCATGIGCRLLQEINPRFLRYLLFLLLSEGLVLQEEVSHATVFLIQQP